MAETRTFFSQRMRKMTHMGYVVAGVFGTLLLVAAFGIKINGAVISPAYVISTGNTKMVQHRDGGIVKDIRVRDGDLVAADQLLIVLDESRVDAEFNVARFKQFELKVKLSRLKSALNGDEDMSMQLTGAGTEAQFKQIIDTQQKLLDAERRSYQRDRLKLKERISLLTAEISALDRQSATIVQQLSVIDAQLAEVAPLVEEQLVAVSREWQLKRDRIAVESQMESIKVQRVKTRTTLTEARNELDVMEAERAYGILRDIEETETELKSVTESFSQLSDQSHKLDIRSPVPGIVHDLLPRNAGAVIKPGETVLQIVPQESGHELKASVQPQDIDQVFVGQVVRLKFDALDARTTPEIFGAVETVSADRLVNEATGQSYYSVTIRIEEDQLDKLGEQPIVSGMPVTAMFSTTNRSLLSYLLRPIEQQAARAFH